MPDIQLPDRFPAFIATRIVDRVDRGTGSIAAADLPAGEVTVRVAWSSVNYKDALASVSDGRVARISPLVPGIDLAGEVVASSDPAIPVGRLVLAHGYEIGVSRHGGYAEFARVPSAWVVPLPDGMTPRGAMAIGTAGFTAAMSVAALEHRGLEPGMGPVLVTGASGGVGSAAVAILAARGHEVWAATSKLSAHDRLRALGASGFLDRAEVTAPSSRPLESERWAGAVDSVGAATLPFVLRSLRRGAAVAASGNTSGAELATTVYPFILRGVALLGMDSAAMPIEERRRLWSRIATDLFPRGIADTASEIGLDELEGALTAILAGRADGRWVVRVSNVG